MESDAFMSIDSPTLSDYTESDDLTHEQAKMRIRNLLVDRAYEDRLSSKDLAAKCPGVSASTVRDLVGDVRREYGVAVYSIGSQGYWDRQSAAERDAALDHLTERIETLKETRREVAAASAGREDTDA